MKIYDISIRLMGVVLGIVLGASGCGGGETHEFHNTGRACLYPSAPPAENLFFPPTNPSSYTADDVLDIAVLLRCMSSTCTVAGSASASCTVEQVGNTLRVDARGSYRDNGDDTCSADCQPLVAFCQTTPVPAGTFTFEYAGQSADLVVPSTALPPCAEWAP